MTIHRKYIETGISGLDGMLNEGFLEGSIIFVSGATGAGKSTLATQFLYNGAIEQNEPGLIISIEESREDFFFHISGYNWDVEGLERDKKLILLDYPIQEVDQILSQFSAVHEIIQNFGAKRLVIDSIMPIALYFKGEDERKRGFLKLIENIRKWGVTTLITSENMVSGAMTNSKTGSGTGSNSEELPVSEYGFESFTDGWLHLSYSTDEKSGTRKRMIKVLKMK